MHGARKAGPLADASWLERRALPRLHLLLLAIVIAAPGHTPRGLTKARLGVGNTAKPSPASPPPRDFGLCRAVASSLCGPCPNQRRNAPPTAPPMCVGAPVQGGGRQCGRRGRRTTPGAWRHHAQFGCACAYACMIVPRRRRLRAHGAWPDAEPTWAATSATGLAEGHPHQALHAGMCAFARPCLLWYTPRIIPRF